MTGQTTRLPAEGIALQDEARVLLGWVNADGKIRRRRRWYDITVDLSHCFSVACAPPDRLDRADKRGAASSTCHLHLHSNRRLSSPLMT